MTDEPDTGERLAEDISAGNRGNAISGHGNGDLLRQQIEFLRAQIKLQDLQAEKLKSELHHLDAEARNIAVANIRVDFMLHAA